MSILSNDEISRLHSAWTETALDYLDVRPLALGGMNPKYRAGLPKYPAPGLQLKADIDNMNAVERLADGTVPLLVWLTNAVDMSAGREAGATFMELIETVGARTAGAPDLGLTDVPEIKEEIIHQDDMVPLSFMSNGLRCAESVARLVVSRFDNGQPHFTRASQTKHLGTGFLVKPTLLVTNHHVVNARGGHVKASQDDFRLQAESLIAEFGYNEEGQAGAGFGMAELCAWHEALDYAVLRLAEDPCIPALSALVTTFDAEAGDDRMPLNIIQHPGGLEKKFAIRNNLMSGSTETDLRYFTDTKPGSSGSPVFDDRWRLVALHRGATVVNNVRYQGRSTAFLNVGTKWSRIMTDLEERFPALAEEISPKR